MDMKEAIAKRHTVRKFKNEPIPQDIVDKLNQKVEEINTEANLNFKFMVNNSDGAAGFAKHIMGKGVNNYLILAGPDTADLDIKLGYYGSEFILYAQTLGLNSWWLGGMYSKSGAAKNLGSDAKINGTIVIGYGQTQGVQHKSKSFDSVVSYEGEMPQWFKEGAEAVLLAPTAINRQAFMIKGKGNKVSLTYAPGHLQNVDLGICKHHFEIGAGKDNFEWEV